MLRYVLLCSVCVEYGFVLCSVLCVCVVLRSVICFIGLRGSCVCSV